jgi:hypothetical protein
MELGDVALFPLDERVVILFGNGKDFRERFSRLVNRKAIQFQRKVKKLQHRGFIFPKNNTYAQLTFGCGKLFGN